MTETSEMKGRALGLDDSVTTCDCCGRSDLKFTVTIELEGGEIAHYGQVCARRNTGRTQAQLNNDIKEELTRRVEAARKEYTSTEEYRALLQKMTDRNRLPWSDPRRCGRESYPFIEREDAAASRILREVSLRHAVPSHLISG